MKVRVLGCLICAQDANGIEEQIELHAKIQLGARLPFGIGRHRETSLGLLNES